MFKYLLPLVIVPTLSLTQAVADKELDHTLNPENDVHSAYPELNL